MPKERTPPDHLRPPPNYFARSVQVRLLMLVFSLLLVLVLMNEARKPQNWAWLWGGTAASETEPAEPVDTRLPDDNETSSAPPGLVYAINDSADVEDLAATPEDEAIALIRREVWSQTADRLDLKQQRLLYRVLRTARHETRVEVEDRNRWGEAFTLIEAAWQQYVTERKEAISEAGDTLPEVQRQRLTSALEVVRTDWESLLQPSLQAVLDDRGWTQSERDSLLDLQRLLDDIMLAEVRDDTVARGTESIAWFRLFEQLLAHDLGQLESAAVADVGFVQLFRQPREYRGKLVTIRGSARWGYRVKARDNDHGIESYYVLWVRLPGSDSPVVIYTLDVPEGFPPLAERASDEQVTFIDEEVEFTAYFFKRWAYLAQDGIRTAPQLLAKTPRWTPPPVVIPTQPSPLLIVGCSLLLAIIAVNVARLVYNSTQRTLAVNVREEYSPPTTEQFNQLADLDVGPSATEALRQLAQDEGDEA